MDANSDTSADANTRDSAIALPGELKEISSRCQKVTKINLRITLTTCIFSDYVEHTIKLQKDQLTRPVTRQDSSPELTLVNQIKK